MMVLMQMTSPAPITHPTPKLQLHVAVQDTRAAHARFVANACTWSMQHNIDVDIDVFSLIIALSEKLRPNVPFNYWTRADVMETIFNVPVYCQQQRTFVPEDFAEQFHLFIQFLSATEWLDPRSDEITELLGVFTATGTHIEVRRPSFALASQL
jgi:hypothetical protein